VLAAVSCEVAGVQQILHALGAEADKGALTVALEAAAQASRWDAFAVLAKALCALTPQELTHVFRRLDKVKVVAAAIAGYVVWRNDVRDLDRQRQLFGKQRQDLAAEKLAVQQLIISMAAADSAKRHMSAVVVEEDEQQLTKKARV
jgi:hypothetical protein